VPADENRIARPHPQRIPSPRRVLAASNELADTSVSIRYSVWSPRYVPWLMRPGTTVQPVAAVLSVAAGTTSRRSGRTATITSSPAEGVVPLAVTIPPIVRPSAVRTVARPDPPSALTTEALMKFDVPMKSATKRLTGRSYSSAGSPIC